MSLRGVSNIVDLCHVHDRLVTLRPTFDLFEVTSQLYDQANITTNTYEKSPDRDLLTYTYTHVWKHIEKPTWRLALHVTKQMVNLPTLICSFDHCDHF